jgi:allantoinase
MFRLLDVLESSGILPAVVVDVLTAERYPALMNHVLPRAGEILAGGLSASRAISSAMSADEEVHYIGATLERLAAVLGAVPAGWLGPEHSESTRTPGLLAAAGMRYVADWGNDEHPYPMSGAGPLWSFPLSWELSDVNAMFHRQVGPETYARGLVEAFDWMVAENAAAAPVLGLHLHPWVSGQAFRADALESALRHLASHDAAWLASPGEVVEWCR